LRVVAACAALALAGCAAQQPRSLYGWGSYEETMYVAMVKPGVLTPEAQVQQFEKDREAIRAAGQKLPPGWRVHLAALYAQTGHVDAARAELQSEKEAFPESVTLCNTLLKNLDGHAEKQP
jgi:hypothetical protein